MKIICRIIYISLIIIVCALGFSFLNHKEEGNIYGIGDVILDGLPLSKPLLWKNNAYQFFTDSNGVVTFARDSLVASFILESQGKIQNASIKLLTGSVLVASLDALPEIQCKDMYVRVPKKGIFFLQCNDAQLRILSLSEPLKVIIGQQVFFLEKGEGITGNDTVFITQKNFVLSDVEKNKLNEVYAHWNAISSSIGISALRKNSFFYEEKNYLFNHNELPLYNLDEILFQRGNIVDLLRIKNGSIPPSDLQN